VNISEEFKKEEIKETASTNASLAKKEHFTNFTYLPDGSSISEEGTAMHIK